MDVIDGWMDAWMEGLQRMTPQPDVDWSHGLHVSGRCR